MVKQTEVIAVMAARGREEGGVVGERERRRRAASGGGVRRRRAAAARMRCSCTRIAMLARPFLPPPRAPGTTAAPGRAERAGQTVTTRPIAQCVWQVVSPAMPAAWRWVYGMASSIRTSDGMVLAERFCAGKPAAAAGAVQRLGE